MYNTHILDPATPITVNLTPEASAHVVFITLYILRADSNETITADNGDIFI